MNDYLKMVNRQKIMIRDINPKAVSTQASLSHILVSHTWARAHYAERCFTAAKLL